MTNFDTIMEITDNLQKALQSHGVRFARKNRDDEKNAPAGKTPKGYIMYTGETFEDTLGQRPGYAEAGFTVKIILKERDPADSMREAQRWAHKIRDAVTVDKLNIGGLSVSKPVSRVEIKSVDAASKDDISSLGCRITVRYRES